MKALLAFAICVGVCLLPFFGGESLVWSDVFIGGTASHSIFWDLRVPRWLLTLGAGGLLSVLGATYQGLFQNPLSEPYIFGVSSAVTLGIILAELLYGVSTYSGTALAGGLLLALVLTFLLARFSNSRFGNQAERIVLFGMGINFFLSSLLFLILSYRNQSVGGGAMRWLFGYIPWVDWKEALGFFSFSLVALSGLLLFARQLDALQLGDSVAKTLGVSARKTRSVFLAITSLIMAVVVLFTGTVGFVGLIIPHVCRLVFAPQTSRGLLFGSFLCGGGFLALSDLASRAVFPPFEFPVGVITTFLGGPVFLYFLWRR